MSPPAPDNVRAASPASGTLTDTILHSATDVAIIAADRSGAITIWNSGAEAILGWPQQEALRQPIAMIFTPEDRATGVPGMEMATADAEGCAADDRWHLRSDGSRFFASGSMMPLRHDDDGRRGYLKILRDQTQARLAEEARIAIARQHAALIDTQRVVDMAGGDLPAVMGAVVEGALAAVPAADGAVVEMREGEEIVYRAAVGSSARHVGLRLRMAGSFSGLCLTEGRSLVCADSEVDQRVDRDACRQVGVRAMLAVPVPHHGRHVGVLKLHTARAGALTEADLPAAQLLVGVLAAGLSGIAEAEAITALRASEAQLKAVFDAVPLGLVLAEAPSGRLVGGNAQVEGMFGHPLLPTPGIESYGAWDCYHSDGRRVEAHEYPLSRAVRGEAERPELEVLYTRPDGQRTWLRLIAAPIRNAAGAVAGGVVAALDIDREKRAEAALRDLNATLGRRVEEEVVARGQAEDTLRQSQKMEALGQLTGGIAHDFNNLLTGITGALEMMRKRMEQGRAVDLVRYIGMAQSSAQRAAALTHRLLAFARRQPLDTRPVEVNGLVAGMEDLLRRTLGEAVTLETSLGEDLWPALCDAHELENAVLNLAINARDAMPDGGRLLIETANATLDEAYARAQNDVRPGHYMELSVSDTGSGMTPAVLARVFEPFFTTKPVGQGTGLGLSMVFGFVKQSGGHVRIHSTVGHGTSVRLYLPRFEGEAVTAADLVEVKAERARAGEAVLVVEDDPAVRALVTEALGNLGYQTFEAGDASSAMIVLASEARIDLLLADLGLPGGVDGYELAEMARQGRPGLKVLVMTGHAGKAALRSGFSGAGLDMITKPFVLGALAAKVRASLERPEADQA